MQKNYEQLKKTRKMNVTKMKVETNMKGFLRWMKQHPRRRLDGFFSVGDRNLTHDEVVRVVNYAVEHGYRTDADIPGEELAKLLKDEQ